MNKLALVIISLFFSIICKSQDFQFNMFFEDAIGNKDTLSIGYDTNGTELIDTLLGEENIIDMPLDSVFDVRISDAFFNNGSATLQTKKQILPDLCSEGWFPVVSIDIKGKHWPVTATWDNSLFDNDCRIGSVFTSFNPGGWWDVGGYPSNLGRVELANENQVIFTSNYNSSLGYDSHYAYINTSNDTIPVFWMAFGNTSLLKLDVESIDLNSMPYPNPVTDHYYFNLPERSIKNIFVTDMNGRSIKVNYENGYIDFKEFNSGYYIVAITKTDGKIIKNKILKK